MDQSISMSLITRFYVFIQTLETKTLQASPIKQKKLNTYICGLLKEEHLKRVVEATEAQKRQNVCILE